MGDLEDALAVEQVDNDSWTATADPRYESSNGMLGGWTLAVALLALGAANDVDSQPSAVTMNFIDKVDPGARLRITMSRTGGSRSISHWLVDVSGFDVQRPLATASAVFTKRQETDEKLSIEMPLAPDPDGLEVFHPPDAFGERCIHRPIWGYPPFNRPDTRSTAWVKDSTGRAVDQAQLAFLADARAPRPYFWSDGPRLSATMTMSVYFHATADELAAVGDAYVLSEAYGVRGVQSTSEDHLRLWSREGALLASSQQLVWFR